jgi:hypothetical protein
MRGKMKKRSLKTCHDFSIIIEMAFSLSPMPRKWWTFFWRVCSLLSDPLVARGSVSRCFFSLCLWCFRRYVSLRYALLWSHEAWFLGITILSSRLEKEKCFQKPKRIVKRTCNVSWTTSGIYEPEKGAKELRVLLFSSSSSSANGIKMQMNNLEVKEDSR